MNDSTCRIMASRTHQLSLLLGLGSLWLASACSTDYPLGTAKSVGNALTADAPTAHSADAAVTGLLGAPDINLSAENGSTGFTAPVGDLDGDGFDDLVTAGTNYDSQLGFMHVRYGGPRPADAAQALAFDESGARLVLPGFETPGVADGVGDVDGDGYDDVVIRAQGAPGADGAFLIYGGPARLEGTLAVESVAIRFVPPAASSPEACASAGASPCAAAFSTGPGSVGLGDIDGDGFADFALTSSSAWGATSPADGVYLFYGGSQRFSGEVPFSDAAATLRSPEVAYPFALGDVDGDGLADLLVGTTNAEVAQTQAPFFVPGQAQRHSGAIELGSTATRLVGGMIPNDRDTVPGLGDLDGDGMRDVLLRDANYVDHIFYGAPHLFDNGLDFSAAAASVDAAVTGDLMPAGDLDGDGADDLLLLFARVDDDSHFYFDYALLGGGRERLSGPITLSAQDLAAPSPASRFGLVQRALSRVTAAGDLDGDGGADLLSVFDSDDPDAPPETDGWLANSHDFHIHYGKPIAQPSRLR